MPAHPKSADVDANILETQERAGVDPTGGQASFAWWVNQVKPKGIWDYKTYAPGYRAYDDFGNFNYGATGAVFTNSLALLTRGAAAARFSHSPWAQMKNYGFGNDPRKNEMIRQGMQYKQNDCGKF